MIGGGAVGRWSVVRIATTTSRSVMSAMTRRRPPRMRSEDAVQAHARMMQGWDHGAVLRETGRALMRLQRRPFDPPATHNLLMLTKG